MGKMAVDEFVATKVLPELVPVVAMLRELMRECAPSVQEDFGYGMPVFKARHIIAYIIPTRKDVTFGFTRGAEFEDRYGLLRGRGKSAKYVKIRQLAEVNRDALLYYLQQALDLDAE